PGVQLVWLQSDGRCEIVGGFAEAACPTIDNAALGVIRRVVGGATDLVRQLWQTGLQDLAKVVVPVVGLVEPSQAAANVSQAQGDRIVAAPGSIDLRMPLPQLLDFAGQRLCLSILSMLFQQ